MPSDDDDDGPLFGSIDEYTDGGALTDAIPSIRTSVGELQAVQSGTTQLQAPASSVVAGSSSSVVRTAGAQAGPSGGTLRATGRGKGRAAAQGGACGSVGPVHDAPPTTRVAIGRGRGSGAASTGASSATASTTRSSLWSMEQSHASLNASRNDELLRTVFGICERDVTMEAMDRPLDRHRTKRRRSRDTSAPSAVGAVAAECGTTLSDHEEAESLGSQDSPDGSDGSDDSDDSDDDSDDSEYSGNSDDSDDSDSGDDSENSRSGGGDSRPGRSSGGDDIDEGEEEEGAEDTASVRHGARRRPASASTTPSARRGEKRRRRTRKTRSSRKRTAHGATPEVSRREGPIVYHASNSVGALLSSTFGLGVDEGALTQCAIDSNATPEALHKARRARESGARDAEHLDADDDLDVETAVFDVPGVRCVGCALDPARLRAVDTFVSDNLQTKDDDALWRIAASVYKRTVVDVCRLERASAPAWHWADVRKHYLEHVVSTKMSRVQMCRELRAIRNVLVSQMVTTNDETGTSEIDKNVFDMYLKATAAESREHSALVSAHNASASRSAIARNGSALVPTRDSDANATDEAMR